MAKAKTRVKQVYRHWVPAAPRKEDFPFSYEIKALPDGYFNTNDPDIVVSVLATTSAESLKAEIKRAVMRVFDYYKYLDENSPDFLPKGGPGPTYSVKVEQYIFVEEEPTGKRKTKKTVQKIISTIGLQLVNFKSSYSYTLVRSLEQLEQILKDKPFIAFDTETTGLNPEQDCIVGMSLSTEPKKGYYVPVAHAEQFAEYNLGLEAIRIVHKHLLKAKLCIMFNARFDMRMIEYTKDDSYDYSLDGINLIDTQITCSFADPEYRQNSLKALEKHFLGYYRDELKDVLKTLDIKTFNFSLVHPELGLFYAAQDAISTYELYEATYQYYLEFGIAGQIDQQLVFILMRLENHAIRLDTHFLLDQLEKMSARLKELDAEIQQHIGDVNLNSPTQKANLLRSFGLDTGEVTETGAMATGTTAIVNMIERLKEEEKPYPKWLELFEERATLDKLINTFFGSMANQLEDTKGRIRINYRLGVTATGRLSSGKEEF
jgi:DNA polymerase-1